jgi:putative phage-type endonuclease
MVESGEVDMSRVSAQAREVLPAGDYLSAEWHQARRGTVSASEVAAIMGLSPWTSRFDLYWQKKSGTSSQAENPDMARGRRLEALVLDDFRVTHPEFIVYPVGLLASIERPWQTASPDAMAREDWQPNDIGRHGADTEPIAVVEAKTEYRNDGEWGEEGTDQIPIHYRCQVMWQMDVTGCRVAYVPVWIGYTYREYVVEYHETDVAMMRGMARDFLTDLEADQPPDVDAHKATRRRLKQLHPSIQDDAVEIAPDVLAAYHAAKEDRDLWQQDMDRAENQIRQQLGDAARGTIDGRKVVSRSVFEVKEHVRRASTTDRLNFSRPKAKEAT